jgi:hypothetical protein
MIWVRRADLTSVHRCQPPFKPGPDPAWPTLFSTPVGLRGDLWCCDDCGSLWRIGEDCDWCDRHGVRPHFGGHAVGSRWRPATRWQRIKYRRLGRDQGMPRSP